MCTMYGLRGCMWPSAAGIAVLAVIHGFGALAPQYFTVNTNHLNKMHCIYAKLELKLLFRQQKLISFWGGGLCHQTLFFKGPLTGRQTLPQDSVMEFHPQTA